jgi:hypothetical protein
MVSATILLHLFSIVPVTWDMNWIQMHLDLQRAIPSIAASPTTVDADPSLTAHLLALVRMRAFAILAMS